MGDVEIDPDRLRTRFEEFNRIGATERGGVNRPALSDANRRARDKLCEWFREAGLTVTVDEMGNVFGRREGEHDNLPPVLVGSHVDSQYNGGRYDGVIGVLGGLEILEALADAGVRTRRPIEVVSWSNEEGVRFQPDMLGSGVFAGAFDLEYALSRTDKEGNTFGDELERIGYAGDEPCRSRDLHSYVELHVEQGPRLERRGLSVAAVEGVYGFAWLSVTLEGKADHAGPTPMHDRQDALVAASDVVGAVRRVAATGGEDLVGTVGSLEVAPDAINVIPETVELTVDLRSHDAEVVSLAIDRIRREIEWAAEREGIDHGIEELMRIDPRTFDPACVESIEAAIDAAGYEGTTLVSGAGHDASYLDDVCPTGMVFVPSVDGVSHRESEFTEWEDVVAGVEVLCKVVRQNAAE